MMYACHLTSRQLITLCAVSSAFFDSVNINEKKKEKKEKKQANANHIIWSLRLDMDNIQLTSINTNQEKIKDNLY